MHKIISSFLIGLLVVTFSCSEEDEVFPEIKTVEIIPLSASNFTVKGNIVNAGSSLVLEYGFVYSLAPTPDVFQGTKAIVGTGAATGSIETTISLESLGGPAEQYTIFVRAYLTNQKGTVYGEVKEFTVPKLTITDVSPIKAKTGDEITITGENFGLNPDENQVKFNGISAEIVAITPTTLTVKVPAGILYPFYNDFNSIYVTTGGQTATATEIFRLLPTITNFSPKTGTFNTEVTITGTDFYPFETAIQIGGQVASATSVSQTQVTFNIPESVTSATLALKMMSGSDVIDIAGNFTIEVPQITSITPMIGIGGTRVSIIGTNFNSGSFDFSNNTVKFGTTEADAINASDTELIAYVPKGLPVGPYPISVFTGVHTVTFPTDFTLTSPTISGFNPTTGIAGSYVTISGANFGLFDELNSVLFGGSLVDIYTWDESSIIVFIPIGTPSGSVKITVNASGQSVASSTNFTIQ